MMGHDQGNYANLVFPCFLLLSTSTFWIATPFDFENVSPFFGVFFRNSLDFFFKNKFWNSNFTRKWNSIPAFFLYIDHISCWDAKTSPKMFQDFLNESGQIYFSGNFHNITLVIGYSYQNSNWIWLMIIHKCDFNQQEKSFAFIAQWVENRILFHFHDYN